MYGWCSLRNGWLLFSTVFFRILGEILLLIIYLRSMYALEISFSMRTWRTVMLVSERQLPLLELDSFAVLSLDEIALINCCGLKSQYGNFGRSYSECSVDKGR